MDAGVVQVTQIVSSLVLVRLLSPSQYGLAGMALIFSSLVLMLSDLSMGAALVQRREITETDRSTVFWCSAAIGTCLTLGGLAVSGVLAAFYRHPAVQPLFAVVSLSFVLVALQTTPASLLQREMRFRAIHVRVATAAVVSSIAGVIAALLGAGAWALIVQQIAMTGTGTILIWATSRWRPSFTFSRKSLRDLGGYGLNLLGANVLNYARNNADNLLVGRFLGSAALGTYAVSFNLMFLPLDRVILPIQETLFPAFSRWQDEIGRLAAVWLRALRLIAAVLVPAMLGFVIVAPEFVDVILGHKWSAAVPVLRILAAVALAQCLALLGQRVLGAINKTHFVFRFSLVEGILTVSAFAIGLQWGIVGVATCYAVVSIPLQILYLALTARAVKASPLEVGRALLGVTLATALMIIACVGLRLELISRHFAPGIRLGVVSFAGVLVYLAASWIFNPQAIDEIRRVRARRRANESALVTT
jgi:O-antigen/teichoic acid export membrane protein